MPRQQGKGNTELKQAQWLPHVKQESCRNACSEIGLTGEEEQETVINCTLSNHLLADSDKDNKSNSQNERKVADVKQQSCRNACSEIGLRGEDEQETVINCTFSDHLLADSDKGDKSNSQNERKVADVKQQSCGNACSEIGLREEEEHETVINCTLSDHLLADSEKGGKSNSQSELYMPKQGVRLASGAFAAPAMADCLEADLSLMNKNPASKVTKFRRPFQSSRVRQNSRRGGRFVRGYYNTRTAWQIGNRNPNSSVSNGVSAGCVFSKTDRNQHNRGSEDDWEAAADALGLQLSLDGKGFRSQFADDNIIADTGRLGRSDCNQRAFNTREDRFRSLNGKVWKPDGSNHLPSLDDKGFHSQSAEDNIIADIGRLEHLDCNQRAFNTREDSFRSLNGKIWKPDGSNRPPPFRYPVKQESLPRKPCRQIWIPVQKAPPPPRAPSHCPICIEELDTTDASFIPCNCSFQLCLFCYNRILSEDARCPGCRKAYDKDMAMKLSSQNGLKRI